MVKGFFAGLLLLVTNDQSTISNWLEGTWTAVEDNSPNYRPHWRQVYTFQECAKVKRRSLSCPGYFGWIDEEAVTDNLLDKSFFDWGVESAKGSTRGHKLKIDHRIYDFILRGRTLQIIDSETGDEILILRKL